MSYLFRIACAMILGFSFTTVNADEGLEKAMYLENIVGDIEEAQKAYETIIAERKSSLELIQRAQIGLLRCKLKAGSLEEVQSLITSLENTALSKPLSDELAKLKSSMGGVDISSREVPWKNGEQLRYRSVNGLSSVSQHLIIQKTLLEADDRSEWHTLTSIWDNNGGGQTVIDLYTDDDQEATRYQVHSGKKMLANGTVREGKVQGEILQTKTAFNYTLPDNTILDHQILDFLRLQPLQNSSTIEQEVFGTAFNVQFKMRFKVSDGSERVVTPAGAFDCAKVIVEVVKSNIVVGTETYWLTADERRLPIKLVRQGITTELVSHGLKPSQPARYHQDELPLSFELPADWMAGVAKGQLGPLFPTIITELDKTAFTGMVYINNRSIPTGEKYDIRDSIYWTKKWFTDNRKDFKLNDSSIEVSISSGHPTVSFWSEYRMNGFLLSEYRHTIATADKEISLIFLGEKGTWEEGIDEIQALIRTIKLKEEHASE